MRSNTLAWVAMVMWGGTGLAHAEGNPKNGLSPLSLRANALTVNPSALAWLTANPLDNTLLTSDLRPADFLLQLHDPHARAVMTELVRCVLPAVAQLTYTDPVDQATYQFGGELGICEDSPWPSTSCQRLATACIAARVNAVGEAIPISIRGIPADMFPPNPAVPQVTEKREPAGTSDPAVGQAITSFAACSVKNPTDCSYKPAYVGTCTVGQTVTLKISDSSCASLPVRVCSGIHGCREANPQEPYSPFYRKATSACPATPMLFSCPATGNYSVMVKTTAASAPAVVATTSGGSYPANENQVFNFREGAFFGNMFDGIGLIYTCHMDAATSTHPTQSRCVFADGGVCTGADCLGGPLPYPHVYACYTQGIANNYDVAGAAYLSDRICAVRGANAHCFAHTPMRCYYSDPDYNATHGSHCTWDAVAGVFTSCKGADGVDAATYTPITTYLNDRCDIVTDRMLCDYNPLGSTGISVPDEEMPDDADGDAGGCAATSSTSSLWAIVLGLGLVIYRRRSA